MKGDSDDFKQEEKQSPLIKGAKELLQLKQEGEIVKSLMGGEEKKETPPQENITATIVTKSMESQDKAMARYGEERAALSLEIDKLRKENLEGQIRYNDAALARAKDIEERAKTAMDRAIAEGAPEKVVERFRGLKELVKELQGEGGARETPTIDPRFALDMEKLKQDHELKMEEIKAGREETNKQWDLKFEQLKEDNKLKWREYEDKKDFRKEGLGGLKEIVESAVAGFKGEKGTGIAGKKEGAREEVMAATISSFLCGKCGTEVPVTDPSQPIVCPNDECKATYTLTPKVG